MAKRNVKLHKLFFPRKFTIPKNLYITEHDLRAVDGFYMYLFKLCKFEGIITVEYDTDAGWGGTIRTWERKITNKRTGAGEFVCIRTRDKSKSQLRQLSPRFR